MLGTSPPAPPLKGRGGRGEGGGAAKWHGHDLGDRRGPGEGSEGRGSVAAAKRPGCSSKGEGRSRATPPPVWPFWEGTCGEASRAGPPGPGRTRLVQGEPALVRRSCPVKGGFMVHLRAGTILRLPRWRPFGEAGAVRARRRAAQGCSACAWAPCTSRERRPAWYG
jgi:hypothetical protein